MSQMTPKEMALTIGNGCCRFPSRRGYAVSMIKAGMKVIGRDSGPVRSPLIDLTSGQWPDGLRKRWHRLTAPA